MANLLKSLAMQWDLWSGRYEAFFAVEKKDVEDCIRILEEVRRKELNRVAGDSVLDSKAFAEIEPDYQLVACRDRQSDEIIGCIRLTKAADIALLESGKAEYQLDLFENDLLDQIVIFTRLAVIRSYRNSPAALVIMSFAFVDILQNGGQAVLMTCEPNLFHMYKRLGLRPIGPLHNSSTGGYRLPMICLPDLAHFKAVRSPALPLLRKINWSNYDEIVQWYYDWMTKNESIETGVMLYEENEPEDEKSWAVTKGLSEKGLKSFLRNATMINCNEGDLLIADQDGSKSFGIVQEGFVRIELEGQLIAILCKGDVFGEMAFILDQKRSANVVAGDSESKVILCSASVLKRIEDESDRTTIWRNLAQIMAKRVQAGNKALLAHKS